MKIELIYDNDGNLMVVSPDNSTDYFYCEYDLPDKVKEILNNIPRYKGAEF